MSNFIFDSLNKNEYHTIKLGDDMIKNYNNKEVKFTFFFNDKGKNLKAILESCYREYIRNEQILTGGVTDGLQKSKNDVAVHL
jgi:hypothetical protein